MNQILESQFTRAQTEVRLDKEHDLAYRRDLAAVRGEHWDEKAQRKAMEAGIDDEAQKRSCGYMKALQDDLRQRSTRTTRSTRCRVEAGSTTSSPIT